MSLTPAEKLVDFLGNFIDYCYNNIETMYGIEHDNEHEPITIPTSYQITCYGLWNAKLSGNDWNWSWWNYGNFNIMYSYDVSYINGNLNYTGFSEIGRFNKNDWDNITEYGTGLPNADEAYRILHEYIASNDQMYIMSTESESLPYEITFMIDDVYNLPKVLFSKNSNSGSVYSKYQGGDGSGHPTGTLFSAQYVNTEFWDFDINIDSDGYVSATTGLNQIPTSYNWGRFDDAVMVTQTDNQTYIDNYITNNGAEHNYTYTYETENGDEITVYYGDNYVIYKCDDDTQITYDDNYNIINKIKEDTDLPVENPTYHDKKYGPPVEPDKDDIDEQDMGVGTNLGGLGGYWLLTKGQLADLHTALNSAPVGFDPLNSFISLIGLGVDVSKVLDATQFQYVTPINIRMSDGTTWQTGVEAHIISSNEIVSAFNSDTFRIPRKYNNFLDYSPYATHELFIPMCGWVTLPDIAVDRDIYVTYLPDIESGKCRAVVSVVSNSEDDEGNGCVIAEKDGIMGSDVPFSNVGHSLFVGDAIINGANVAGEAITMAIGAGFTKTGAKGNTFRPYQGFTLGGAGTLPGAIGNAIVSGNLNRTHFMTGNSTKTGFSDGESIIVKSVYHLPDMPDNYAHTVGLVCNKTGQLNEFNGFTVCDNPHITFSALEAEKEEIKRLLEEGVILPSGE